MLIENYKGDENTQGTCSRCCKMAWEHPVKDAGGLLPNGCSEFQPGAPQPYKDLKAGSDRLFRVS